MGHSFRCSFKFPGERYLSCHPSQCVGYAHYRRSISRVCYIGQTLNHVSWLRSEAALLSCSARVWPTTTVGLIHGQRMLQIVILLQQAHMFLSASTWRQPGMGYKGERTLETTILTPFGCTFRTDVLRYDLPPAVDQPWSWSRSLPADSWQFPRFREFGKVVCGERLSAQAIAQASTFPGLLEISRDLLCSEIPPANFQLMPDTVPYFEEQPWTFPP